MDKRNCLLGLLLLLGLLSRTAPAFAAEEPYVNSVRGASVAAGSSFYVTDEKFLSPTIFYNTIRSAPYSLAPENIVELKLNYDTSIYFYNKPFTATVNVTILCYNNAYDTSQVFTQYNNVNLTIKHDTATGVPYKGVYFMKFAGAYKFRVIINSVTCPELGSALPPVLIVEGKTVIKRKYNFSAFTLNPTIIEDLGNQYRLSWVPAYYPGADMFDLEYTVVDDSSLAGASIRYYLQNNIEIPPLLMESLFRNNASRITTPASSYTFNPMYRAGYLLFRIRSVQFPNEYQTLLSAEEQNLRTEGSWNYAGTRLGQPWYQYNVIQLQWHQPNLNWQYTVSFAEEGKRKEVIGYFDGIFKNRQNVTINNSDNKSVVQETIYDALGRPAINVLPVPTNDNTLHYFGNFNQNNVGQAYSYLDFAFGNNCRTIPATMSANSGSSLYYSPNNNINDYFFKKYIPQAEGYPFSVTEFTPDNTGRIFAQSGVGKDFQPGTNHETKYYYGKPSQEELDRMFGSEAGNASHYLKNMVVDPNGQISVSYLNASGKTVATALAGLTPNNTEALSSNNGTGTDVTHKLLKGQDFTKDYAANTLLGYSTFLAAVSGNYKFTYNLTPLRLDVQHGSNNQYTICNTCYYDLEIKVSDNCNQVLTTISRPVDPNTIFQTNCSITPAPIVDSFDININNIGEYNVSYLLKVSERAWAYYDSVHLAQNTNIRSFNSFAIEKLKNADFKGCFSECSTCLQELGNRADFINNKIKPLFIQADSLAYTAEFDTWANALYDSLLLNCNSIQAGCNASSPCDEEKAMLLEDVKPGGQYSLFTENYLPVDILTNIVYNQRGNVIFYNEDGSPGMIEWNGQSLPANNTSIPIKVFIENFQDSWAEALLPYHPEYCFYQWCLYGNNPQSKAFDNTITDIEDDVTATTKGYFGSVASLLNNDPFFSSSGSGYAYYSQMLDSLNLFSRTVPGYSGADYNIRQYIDYELYCEELNVTPANCAFPAPGAPCRSPYMEWQLYRDYYLNLKEYFQAKARMANPLFANCRNCYIGTDNTEFLVCSLPSLSDITMEIDLAYTGPGKKVIIKYKNAEAAAPFKWKLTFSYNYGTVTGTFRPGRATETFILPASVNNYYTISQIQCDTSTSIYSRIIDGPDKELADLAGENVAVTTAANSVDNPAAMAIGCPCPTSSSFSASFSGLQCWEGGDDLVVYYYGPEIPPGRTVYVEVYWYDYNTGNSGVATVSFTGTQTVAHICVNGGLIIDWKTAPESGNRQKTTVKETTAQVVSKKGIPTPEALQLVQLFRDSVSAAQRTGNQDFENAKPPIGQPPIPNYYVYIQNVYCYNSPGFVCPGTVVEPVSLCKDDPLYPYYKDKIRRYNGYQNTSAFHNAMMANYGNYQGLAQANMISDCQANCEAQADVWINSLRKCTTDENVLASIKAGLIAVCQSGCDADHLMGSSTNPSLSQSFESVIRSYIPNSSDSCTAELISDPYPYNRQPQFEGRMLIKIDNCLSSRLSQLKTQYLNSGYAGTFHQWLQKQLKNDYRLTAQELADMETAIGSGCKYLKKPLLLPAALNCSNTPACVDSATTLQTYAAFLAKYPGITVTNANFEILLTNYFNHTLGFNLNFEDYWSYIEKCQTGTTNKDLLCNRALSSQVIVKEDVMQCMSDVFDLAIAQAVNEYTVYIDSVRTVFRNSYMTKCLSVEPGLTMRAKLYEYHYTLYYYDQSGNLVKTIPPAGVVLLNDAQVAQVQLNRLSQNGSCYNNAPELNFTANLMTMNRELSYDPVVGGKYTLEVWLKLSNLDLTGPNGIFSYNDITSYPTEAGYALLHRNGKLYFSVGTTPKLQVETPLLNTFLSANTWFHLAITVNNASGTPVKMYINGNNVPLTYLNSNSSTYAVYTWNTHKLRIGAAFENNVLSAVVYTGIKQFRWYQRELGLAEIQQNAFDPCLLISSDIGLVSHIPVNEGSGTVIRDMVNGNVSTMTGNGSTAWQNFASGLYPNHRLPSTYQYNSYNQVVRQNTPDGGASTFWYDVLGRLVASQNNEQKTPKNTANNSANRYSYTKYDAIGRITEVGEKYSGSTLYYENEGGSYDTKSASSLATWYNTGTDRQVTMTIYDQPNLTLGIHSSITNLQTSNARKRVVATIYKEIKANSYYDFATHYVYDITGNVKTLFQDLKPMRDVEWGMIGRARGVRRIDYEYDLVSGKVNRVYYQRGTGDQFIHKYDYDADNRLTEVYTSRNGLQWQRDAKYYYYLHGPLARTELGKHQVQGVDYAYTLQGWLKGINSQVLDPLKDMAGDGNQGSPTFKKFGRDVYGYSIGYHANDYKPIGGSAANAFDLAFTAPSGAIGASGNTGAQLFNGNISYTTVALNKINGAQTAGYSYLYDQLNRIMGTRQHTISGSTWNYSSYNAAYEEKVSYDANGNIKTYVRKGANTGSMPLAMDNLKYFYYYTNTSNARSEYDPTQPLPNDVKTLTNQLAHVDDLDPSSNYTADIDDQDPGNYDYDNIGNLIRDIKDSISSINWTVYGKIRQVVKTSGVTINYQYDAAGNRVVKEVIGAPGGYNRQFYVRDAQGNTMAVYKDQSDHLDWMEQHIYGSSRLGIWNYGNYLPGIPLEGGEYDSIMVGSVQYELTNHLGNVLTTISDKKIGNDSSGHVNYYLAEVLSQNDYYPFGMLMPARQYTAGNKYRYGFNGKENDNEVKGEGNSIDFGARIYDPRICNWMSVDPLQSKYPGLSPYNFVNNSPVNAYDPDGRLIIFINGWPGFGACCPGTAAYWGGWDQKAMDRIMDHNAMYVDGSSKYLLSLPSTRYKNGYELGKKQAADVIANLKKDANGDIVESIKIITSSQGAATERGYSQALVDYVNDFNKSVYQNNVQELTKQADAIKNGKLYSPNIKKPIEGFNIEYNADVSAFQGNLLEADKNANNNYYMRNGGAVTDWIGPSTWSQKIKGAVELGLDKDGKPKSKGHHPSWFDADELPQDKDKVDDTKKVEYGPNKAAN